MFHMNQFDNAIYGYDGGSRDIPEREGRMYGGGWIQRPEAYSDHDAKGIWAQPPARDGEENNFGPRPGEGTLPGNTYWNMARSAAGSPAEEGGWF